MVGGHKQPNKSVTVHGENPEERGALRLVRMAMDPQTLHLLCDPETHGPLEWVAQSLVSQRLCGFSS